MDIPFLPDDPSNLPRPRGPLAAWIPLAIIGAVLGAASVAASMNADTRDFAARHATVLPARAL